MLTTSLALPSFVQATEHPLDNVQVIGQRINLPHPNMPPQWYSYPMTGCGVSLWAGCDQSANDSDEDEDYSSPCAEFKWSIGPLTQAQADQRNDINGHVVDLVTGLSGVIAAMFVSLFGDDTSGAAAGLGAYVIIDHALEGIPEYSCGDILLFNALSCAHGSTYDEKVAVNVTVVKGQGTCRLF